MLTLKEPTPTDLYDVAEWRNLVQETLRTTGETTREQQLDFYRDVICDEESKHKYFSVYEDNRFIGFTGLTDISFENLNAEISLIVNPKFKKQGYGKKLTYEILDYAFNVLELMNVYGECYVCNDALDFWFKVIERYDGSYTILPERKIYDGMVFDSLYFTINKRGFKYGKIYTRLFRGEH